MMIVFFASLSMVLVFSGCDFFGKKSDDNLSLDPGQLSNGTSIVGTWSASYSDVSTSRNPSYAMTQTLFFEPTGVARLEVRESHINGKVCTGYGQYRMQEGNNVVVYVQKVVPSDCLMPAQVVMTGIQVTNSFIRYTDGNDKNSYVYFADREQRSAPVGVWRFDNAVDGSIDYLFFDPHGYFIMQTTLSSAQYLLLGYYTISNGALTLVFFVNGDPSQTTGLKIVFDQFATDGQVLQLSEPDGQGGQTLYNGIRL